MEITNYSKSKVLQPPKMCNGESPSATLSTQPNCHIVGGPTSSSSSLVATATASATTKHSMRYQMKSTFIYI